MKKKIFKRRWITTLFIAAMLSVVFLLLFSTYKISKKSYREKELTFEEFCENSKDMQNYFEELQNLYGLSVNVEENNVILSYTLDFSITKDQFDSYVESLGINDTMQNVCDELYETSSFDLTLYVEYISDGETVYENQFIPSGT